MSKCNCVRAATATDNRAYEAQIRSLGGYGSPAAKAWIDEQHAAFKATQERCRAEHGTTMDNGGCVPVLIAAGGGLAGLLAAAIELVRAVAA